MNLPKIKKLKGDGLLAKSTDIHFVETETHQYILVGTAHISPQSAQLVKEAIEHYQPQIVCLELDEKRYQAMEQKDRFDALNFKQIIKQKKLATLLVQLVLSSYQSRMGEQLNVKPGVEMLEGKNIAKQNNIPIALCDREVGITLKRAWRKTSLFKKLTLLSGLLGSLFSSQKISEEQMNQLKSQDLLSNMMQELGQTLPSIKTVLIDERDIYLAEKIKKQKSGLVLAVIGAGHVEGVKKYLQEPAQDLKPLEEIPKIQPISKWIAWGIPLALISALVFMGIQNGLAQTQDDIIFWIAINAILAGLGAIIALAHPLTILASLTAPLTSLIPIIGVGYVCVFVQAIVCSPKVTDLKNIRSQTKNISAWWSNRALRIFLVFILTSLGSMLASAVGGAKIFTSLYQSIQGLF